MNEQEFNGLTAAQKERLYLLSEEASEIIKEVMKILRFGYESHHPDKPEETNLVLLQTELGNLGAAMGLMFINGDIDVDAINAAADDKYSNYSNSPFIKQEHKFW